MKKTTKIFLLLMLIISLYSCENMTENIDTTFPIQLIEKDIEEDLSDTFYNSKLESIDVIKSMTKDDKYEASLKLLVKTEYADWTYEVEVVYKKYDQGWLKEKIDYTSESYQMTKVPDKRYLCDIVETQYPNKYDIDFERASVLDNDFISKETVVLVWNEVEEGNIELRVRFKYNSSTDKWNITNYSNGCYIYGDYITTYVSIEADNKVIINDVKVKAQKSDEDDIFAIDVITKALDKCDIEYTTIEFGGYEIFEKISNYDVEDFKYLWELYLNGSKEPVQTRFATVKVNDGDKLLLKRNLYE